MKEELQGPHRIFFETLGNQKRWEIVTLLEDRPLRATEISDKLGYEQSLISHHLKRLLTCGFVHVQPNGTERVYSLNEKTIQPLLKQVHQHIKTYCEKKCTECGL
jgi:DNA-binding transcriptional ArsR family regulator